MSRQRKWYADYIGYCFNDDQGREVILTDVFYFVDENGKPTGTGYEVYYPDTKEYADMEYRVFKRCVADCTQIPRR